MKFLSGPFTIDKKYARELANKVELFQRETGTRKSVMLTFITTYGLSENAHSNEMVQEELTMDVLFENL